MQFVVVHFFENAFLGSVEPDSNVPGGLFPLAVVGTWVLVSACHGISSAMAVVVFPDSTLSLMAPAVDSSLRCMVSCTYWGHVAMMPRIFTHRRLLVPVGRWGLLPPGPPSLWQAPPLRHPMVDQGWM